MDLRRPSLYLLIFLLTATQFLDSGMTAFAAGPIMGEISISPEDFSLIAAIYASIAILSISMLRWLVERLGGRGYVQSCIAVSIIGSALCATSHDFNSFLLGRAVMALGGGGLFTAARMIIHHRLAGPARFVGIKALASGVAINIAAAPWLASVAVSNETWSMIYWLLAALGVIVFALAGLTLTSDPIGAADQRSEAVLWQQALLVGGSFLFLYALQRFNYDFFGDVLFTELTLGAALIGLAVYVHIQRSSARPLLRIAQLLRPRYLAGLALFMVAYVMLSANNYMVPMLLQHTLGYAWETVGHFEALGLAFTVLTWLVMSRLLPRYPPPRKFLVTGFLSLAVFGGLLTRIDTDANLWFDILPALACNSIFLLTVMPVSAMQTFREQESDESVFSNAQQIKNMLAQAGIAVGITLATLGQQWRTAVHYGVLNAQINPGNPVYTSTIQHLQQALTPSVGPLQAAQIATTRVAQLLAQQASMLANIDHFTLIALIGVLGIAVTLTQRVFR